jgi:hypothetical protein
MRSTATVGAAVAVAVAAMRAEAAVVAAEGLTLAVAAML